MPAPATCLRRRSLQRSSCGPRGACRPRLPERLFEVALHRALERAAERAVVTQEALAGARQPHAALGAAARRALHELEAGRVLQLAQVAPGVAVRHLECLGRLLERAALLDRLQQSRAALAEFQVVAERHPDPELRLHIYMGAPKWPPTPPSLLAPRHSRGAPRSSSRVMGAPTSPPTPPSLVAPRHSRGAPRSSSRVMGAPTSPPSPLRSSRPANAGARLDYYRAAIARAMRSGVIGSSVSRTPVASSMALARAAGAGTIGGSPTPRAPNGPAGDGFSTMMVSMFGRSAAVSLR